MDVSLEELLDKAEINTDVIDQECLDGNILDIATKFCDQWQMIGRHLKLKENEITTIDNDFKTTPEKSVQMLIKWKGKFGPQATYRVLMEAFISNKQADKAQGIIELIKHQKTAAGDDDKQHVEHDIRDLVNEFSGIQRKYALHSSIAIHELKEQCSALNPEILNDLISETENEEIKQQMKSYMAKLQLFRCKTNLASFVGMGESLGPSPLTFSRLDIEFHDDWTGKTLEDLENFRSELPCKPCFLTRMVVAESLTVVFSIPQQSKLKLECLVKYLDTKQILRIVVGGECIFPPEASKGKSAAERLLLACKNEDATLVEEVLNSETFSESDLRYQDESGNSPLMLASLFGNEETVHLLLSHNARVDSRNYKGQTALMLASEKGYDSIVEELLDHDASIIDLEDNNKYTALTHATIGRHKKVVSLLVSHGAQVDTKTLEIAPTVHDASIRSILESRAMQPFITAQVQSMIFGLFTAVMNIARDPTMADGLELLQKNDEQTNTRSTSASQESSSDPISTNALKNWLPRVARVILGGCSNRCNIYFLFMVILFIAFLLYLLVWYPVLFLATFFFVIAGLVFSMTS